MNPQGPGVRWTIWLLVAVSMAFPVLPDTFTMNAMGPELTHSVVEGSLKRQIVFGSLFLGAALLAWRCRGSVLRNLRGMNIFLPLVVLYCLVSAAWSPYPEVTMKRTFIVMVLFLIGVAVAPPTGMTRQVGRITMGAYTLILVISFFVVLIDPGIGVDYALGDAWRGITWQKNTLGSIAGFAALFYLREAAMQPQYRGRYVAGLLFCMFMLVMSKSATSMLCLAVSAGIYLVVRRRHVGGRHAEAIVVLAGVVAALFALLLFYVVLGRMPTPKDLIAPVTALFNKSADLTGRDQIWDLVDLSIQRHPLLGIGYSAFWTGTGGPSQYIADKLGWMPAHAHNGFLDIINDMGQVGFGLFMACLLWHLYSILRLARMDREDAAMHLGICVAIIISNFSESQLLRDSAFQNALFIYSVVAVGARLAMARSATRTVPGASLAAPSRLPAWTAQGGGPGR
ncbi:O-antigen ligase family protein [Achromobacter aloeverae]|nr:O-antigen ligase family protein [Achromobacter aloeverae]